MGEWFSLSEGESAILVQILNDVNILEKNMNPTIFPPAMGKYKARLGSLALVWQLFLKETSGFKPNEDLERNGLQDRFIE